MPTRSAFAPRGADVVQAARRTQRRLAALVLALALLIAGCGGDDATDGEDTATPVLEIACETFDGGQRCTSFTLTCLVGVARACQSGGGTARLRANPDGAFVADQAQLDNLYAALAERNVRPLDPERVTELLSERVQVRGTPEVLRRFDQAVGTLPDNCRLVRLPKGLRLPVCS